MENFLSKLKEEFEKVENGETGALEFLFILNSIEKEVKIIKNVQNIKSKCLELAIDEAEKYTEKSFDYKGFTITKTNRTQYIFDDCNDPKMTILTKQEKDLKAEVKERKDFLKYLKEPLADIETGEVIYPAVKIAKDTLTIKKKK